MDDEQSPQSNKKNISDEINSLKDEIQEDLNDIINYKINTRDRYRDNQDELELYLDMIEECEKRINKNTELLKTKIQELINHPLNSIHPSRERPPSQSGGTKKNRGQNKRKNKRKRTMPR
jgi:hypothetical protein